MARSSKAWGTHRATTNMAAMATNITRRVRPSSGSTRLVSQAYPTHDHHSTPSTSRPCTTVRQPWPLSMSEVHWVMASTKTRSKNSSRGVTVAPSRRRALMR